MKEQGKKFIFLFLPLVFLLPAAYPAEGGVSDAHRKTVRSAQSDTGHLTGLYHAIRRGRLPLLSGQPIYIRSETSEVRLKADVYSIVRYPLADLSRELAKPQNWCQFLTLHLNVKACTYRLDPAMLSVYAGRKFYEPPQDAYRLDYHFRVIEQSSKRLVLLLRAEKGQLSTHDYRIKVTAEAMSPGDVMLHFSLAYQRSLASRMATRAYLATLGNDKVGFSRPPNNTGEKNFIKGVGGIIERNAMRYFLALSVYMDTLAADSRNPQHRRSRLWFELTERYGRQLHELDKIEYLAAKRREFENQKKLQSQIDNDVINRKQPAER